MAAGNLASVLAWTPGRRKEAREAYLTAILLADRYRKDRPNDAVVLARLGVYDASIGDATKSLPLTRQALALDPKNPQVLYKASEAYELMRRRQEALDFLGRAIPAGYSMEYIRRQPELAGLRTDPKYSALSSNE